MMHDVENDVAGLGDDGRGGYNVKNDNGGDARSLVLLAMIMLIMLILKVTVALPTMWVIWQ